LRDHVRPQGLRGYPKPGRAGYVGDDVVKLRIHLSQGLLHVLDV